MVTIVVSKEMLTDWFFQFMVGWTTVNIIGLAFCLMVYFCIQYIRKKHNV